MTLRFIRDTIRFRREINKWQRKYDAKAPKVGDPAPDFEILDVSGNQSIRLSDFENEKPAALIFGSFT